MNTNDPTYFIFPASTPADSVKDFREFLKKKQIDNIVLRDPGATSIKIIRPEHNRKLKAICLYCGSANVHSSLECAKCGATLLEAE